MHALVFAEPDQASCRVAGVPVLERLLRALARADVTSATIITSGAPADAGLLDDARARAGVALTWRTREARTPPQVSDVRAAWPEGAEHVLVFPQAAVFDPRLIVSLSARTAPAALVDSAAPEAQDPLHQAAAHSAWGLVCGPALIDRRWLVKKKGDLAAAVAASVEAHTIEVVDVHVQPSYIPALHRNLRPVWFPPPSSDSRCRLAEHVLLDAVQKKVVDVPGYVHAPLENALVRASWALRVRPGQVALLSCLVAAAAAALFAVGRFEVGILLAIAAGILTEVPSKLARVRLEARPAERLCVWIENAFELSWAAAIASYIYRSGLGPDVLGLLALLLGAEALSGAARYAVLRRFGRAVDDVAPFERRIRLAAGRRNAYVWVFALGIFVGAVPEYFALIAHWAVLTAAVRVVRAVWLTSRAPLVVD